LIHFNVSFQSRVAFIPKHHKDTYVNGSSHWDSLDRWLVWHQSWSIDDSQEKNLWPCWESNHNCPAYNQPIYTDWALAVYN
jgi:hypothetical protein